jgi:glycosyltransferase involved in cell wall biosynthesis
MKKYLICQEWRNTANNHAGMKHMCMLLKKYYPDDYEVIAFPQILLPYTRLNFKTSNIYYKIYAKFLLWFFLPYLYKVIVKQLATNLKKDDAVYFLEYCEKMVPVYNSVMYLKKHCPNNKIYGMVHLIPSKLNRSFSVLQLRKWLNPLDGVLTLGTSLTEYFVEKLSLSDNKVKTLFHYVDLDYYKVSDEIKLHKALPRILVQGNQARDIDLLLKIVNDNPDVQFTICQGGLDLREKFKICTNVKLIGFVEETELLSIMQESDISLNVMDDTIGSNVIVTSMAVGLAMIASDVGSIRDYCKDDGAIYCNNNDVSSFSKAINELLTNSDKLFELKQKSVKYSQELSIHKLHKLL